MLKTGRVLVVSLAVTVLVPLAACSHSPAAPPAGVAGTAMQALDRLDVKPWASGKGYSRAKFGTAWTDDNDVALGHNGCNTRNDILARDLQAVTYRGKDRCVVGSGTLTDPYTGRTVAFHWGPSTSAQVQIDHVVALDNAWKTGAAGLSQRARTNLANDPLNLQAVAGSTNDAKGNEDAAGWLPPRKEYDCRYVARQIAVKAKYELWVTAAEKRAMNSVLVTCPDESLPLG